MAYNFSFSYSKFSMWDKCPKQYKLAKIDKIDTGPTPKPLLDGRKVHDDIKDYLNGKIEVPARLTKHFSVFGDQLQNMNLYKSGAVEVIVEEQMGFDRGKRRCKWFGPNTYYRFIWDAAIVDHGAGTIYAVDWKTGKPYDSYEDQMQIFSMPGFWMFPEIHTFKSYLMFLDSGDVEEGTITREDFEQKVEPKWTSKIRLFESDDQFIATPSPQACKWCDFGKNKMGICGDSV